MWWRARCWSSVPRRRNCTASAERPSRRTAIDVLLGVRGAARQMVEAARAAGMAAEFVETPQQAGEWLAREVRPGDAVLLKASRGVKLEGALESLAGTPAGSRQQNRGYEQEGGGRLLYWLLYVKLFPFFSPFRIFRYLTFRTAFASLTALATGLIVGPAVIRRLREFQIGQYIREEGPKAHQKKAGTPTMGGVLIAISIVVPTLLWADLSNIYVWIAVLLHPGVRRHRLCRRLPEGDPPSQPRPDRHDQADAADPGQPGGGRGADAADRQRRLLHPPDGPVPEEVPSRPGDQPPDAQPLPVALAFMPFMLFVVLVIVGSSNAVNLTDGLDGLAIGCTVIAAGR